MCYHPPRDCDHVFGTTSCNEPQGVDGACSQGPIVAVVMLLGALPNGRNLVSGKWSITKVCCRPLRWIFPFHICRNFHGGWSDDYVLSHGNLHIPTQVVFEDDFPFPKVEYISSVEGTKWDDPPSTLLGTNISPINLHFWFDYCCPFLVLVGDIFFWKGTWLQEKWLTTKNHDKTCSEFGFCSFFVAVFVVFQ